ncbi:MAG: ribosome small subunit-dependent GTPase A [Rehaibacterium terrae]|uniref:ribosome small subunit-dependent GTPase A n=1 Tax=Rehaibacterium terrae TaxID=1341696 RepID=UPI003919A2B2
MRLDPLTLVRLRTIGWPDDAWAEEALRAAPRGRLARVVEQHRSGYVVSVGEGEEFRAQAPAAWLRPRFPPEQRACVGDWVVLDDEADEILALLPRRSLLKRGAAGEHYRQQLIAANIDYVLVVCGLDHDFNPRRLERYLVLVQGSGATPVLVLTKADLCQDLEPVTEALADILALGVQAHPVNAKDPASVAVLDRYLQPGRSVVLVGSSGAGKSTLTNTLLGVEKMKTGEVRVRDSRGRHTTTWRALIPLPQGGCLIDTPGMRELKLTGEERLDAGAFADIEALAASCRFNDCGHRREPGCAVRAALEAGTLDADHYANYLKLRDELAAAAGQLAARLADKAEAKVMGKALDKRLKEKYGRR